MAIARGTASRARSSARRGGGGFGGFGANHHLRQSLVFLNVAAMAQPEVYLGGAGQAVQRKW